MNVYGSHWFVLLPPVAGVDVVILNSKIYLYLNVSISNLFLWQFPFITAICNGIECFFDDAFLLTQVLPVVLFYSYSNTAKFLGGFLLFISALIYSYLMFHFKRLLLLGINCVIYYLLYLLYIHIESFLNIKGTLQTDFLSSDIGYTLFFFYCHLWSIWVFFLRFLLRCTSKTWIVRVVSTTCIFLFIVFFYGISACSNISCLQISPKVLESVVRAVCKRYL